MNPLCLLHSARVAMACTRNINCWTASITKKHRTMYEKTYPIILVLPDGSSIHVDYHQPVRMIQLPLDLAGLTESERKLRLMKRRPKAKIAVTEEIEDDFDENRYLKYMKK